MNLATEIQTARRKLCLTQEEAATKWGINLGTLRQYEQGKRTPRGLAMTMLRQILDSAAASTASPPSSASPESSGPPPSNPLPPKAKRVRRRP